MVGGSGDLLREFIPPPPCLNIEGRLPLVTEALPSCLYTCRVGVLGLGSRTEKPQNCKG